MALFMESMDATVISTSLPAIAADIGTTSVALKLAFTAYYVAMGIFVPMSAWLADRYGCRNVLRFSMALFILGSLGCAASQSLAHFVCARFIEGAGAAFMAPVARLALFRVTPREELVSATSWLTIPPTVAPMFGPPLGGFLTTYVAWQWIFVVNLPMAIAGIVLITRLMADPIRLPTGRLDLFGLVLVAISLSGLVFGASLISMPVLPAWLGLSGMMLGAAAGIAYFAHARKSADPVLDLRVFREPTFRATTIGTTLMLMGCAALPFLTALMLQLGFGMDAFQSGLLVFSGAIGALAAKFVVAPLFKRLGFRRAMTCSALLAGIGIGVKATLLPSTPALLIVLLLFVNGLIRSVYFTGHAVLTVADTSPEQAGHATAIAAVSRPVASALSFAMAGGLLTFLSSGGTNTIGDFHMAIGLGAALCGSAALAFLICRPSRNPS
ncbi:MFS transporter [Rhizobium puerariae]|uniref:MFS transporter n=1 Tax=Rhizobium puerariae TaxID=1585791 RepID=A0ABV6AP62_9HYPH